MNYYDKQVDKAREIGIDFDRQVSDEPGSGFLCLCGCGQATRFNGKKWVDFRPGHDARLVGNLLKKARAGEININEAIDLLEFATGSDKLSNKLRRHWLRADTKRADLVEYVKRHALDHISDGGWDVIVECWDDDMIAKRLAEVNARSYRTALAAFRSLVATWADRQADARNSAF